MDELDVRREANKMALEVMESTGATSKAVRRGLGKSMVLRYYMLAVEHRGVPAGMREAWLTGWRKGYGL